MEASPAELRHSLRTPLNHIIGNGELLLEEFEAAVPSFDNCGFREALVRMIGHAREMAAGSGVSLCIDSAKVPLLEGALDCVRSGFIPGGLKNNREFAECLVGYEANVPEEIRTILFDPQTAGGLLLSVARADTEALVTALNNAGVPAVEIGEVLPQGMPV